MNEMLNLNIRRSRLIDVATSRPVHSLINLESNEELEQLRILLHCFAVLISCLTVC